MNKRPALLSAIGFTFVLLALLSMSFTAQATPQSAVPQAPTANALHISQAYGGGGSGVAGTAYKYDYVELLNAGSSAVDISGWSLQYGSATGNFASSASNLYTFTTGTTIAPGKYLLVQLGTPGAAGLDLPTPDFTTTNLLMSGSSGKVALANISSSLGCGGTALPCTLPDARIVDLVAWGNVTSTVEITAVNYPTALSSIMGVVRKNNGCQDTDNNYLDFTVVASPTLIPRNSASPVNLCVASEADLSIAKFGPATASAGDPITYTINLSDTGTTTATTTIVTDTLPTEVAFITYTGVSAVSFSQSGQTLVWNLGNVAGGAATLQIEVQGTISTGLSNGTTFVNMVSASTTAVENTTANNTSSVTTTIGAPDLIVLKYGPASVNAGDPVVYTLTYSNVGDLPATGVRLVDQLPAAMSYVADSLGGTRTGNTITWTLGSLPIDASGSIVLTATALTAGDQANIATISGGSADSNPLNNVSVFTTTILGADPYAIKTGPAAVFGGELITYTLVYGNFGNAPAAVEITDTLPVSFTTSAIAYDNSGLTALDDTNTRSWTRTLQASDRFTFTLALTVPTAIAGNTRITNTLDIATETAGNVAANDRATASSTIYQIVPIAQARAGTNGQVFGIEGSVIYVPGTLGTNEWGIQDASGGISMFYTPVPVAVLGDRMRVVATRAVFSGQPQLGTPLYYSANLGSGPQVTPKPFTTGQVASGASEGWLIVITGTVSNLTACSTTANYQFDLDDGSGSTVIFVDKDTLVNVCSLGVVNGDPLVVTGFSTQYNGVPELKPRFPADVQRIYQVTFVYNDLEDVVAVGEDVQLRGEFTNGATNPITLSHDAGYTVFSTTLTLPTDVAQNYKYYVPAAGGSGYDLLNTNNRSIAPQDGVNVQTDYRNVVVGGANLNGPASQVIHLGSPTAVISGQLYVQGVTDPAGAGRGLKAEVGYGTSINPASWSWSAATYITDTGNNDVYGGVFTPTASGVYSYATRYNGNWGIGNPNSLWTYASLNGIPFDLAQAGVLTVTAPQLSITKTVAAAHPMVDLGEVVTYTFTLSNTGNGAAAGVLITDVVPAAVTFGGFAQQNGAVFGSGAITWNGSLNAGASATVIFTATVNNDRSLYGTNVANTVQFTSGNDGSGNTSATFAIVKRYFTYLPLIKR